MIQLCTLSFTRERKTQHTNFFKPYTSCFPTILFVMHWECTPALQGHSDAVGWVFSSSFVTEYRLWVVLLKVFCTCVAREESCAPWVQSPVLVLQVVPGREGRNICNYRYLKTDCWEFTQHFCVAWMQEVQFRPWLLSVTSDLAWPIWAAKEEPDAESSALHWESGAFTWA